MEGQVWHEEEVKASAAQAWKLYGGLELAKLAEIVLNNFISRVDLLHGDGGVGTLLKLHFLPGSMGEIEYSVEKFTKIDKEKYVKETEVTEGGYMQMGCSLYRVRFEITEKEKDCCIIKSTIEYKFKPEAAVDPSVISIQPFQLLAQAANNYLINKSITNPN